MAAAAPKAFYCLWQEERIRETLFDELSNDDICSVRLANSACCNLVTKRLFLRTQLTFTANTFTKPSRIQALSRVGHHIEHLTFCLPHSDATFLPPLLHPLTGREISFLYTPHTSMASVLTRPKYGSPGLGDVLTQQYPPLFHAATNVPSFLTAMKHLTNMRHLTIRCPGQEPQERYRRDIVDYALISLRISIERAPLLKLTKLSLSGIHPAAFNYLRHVPGFGAVPSAGRRWRQIRKLYIAVDSWDFYGPSPGLDHLRIIDDYIRNMSPHLEKLSFTWLSNGSSSGSSSGSPARKGPCPIALAGDPLFAPPRDSPKKLFNEVTGPMSPLPPAPRRRPMQFSRLRCLTLRNATMNMPQLRDLVERHKRTVREFDFENVSLVDGSSWEEAFAPVLDETSDDGSDVWSAHRGRGGRDNSNNSNNSNNTSPDAACKSFYRGGSPPGSPSSSSASSAVTYGPAAVASPDDIELAAPSAAVAAVSRDLLDLGVEDLETFLGFGQESSFSTDIDVLEELPPVDALYPAIRTPPPPTIPEAEEEEEREDERGEPQEDVREDEDDGGLASDIAAAHEASLAFTTRIKKRHMRRQRRHRRDDSREREPEERRSRSHHRHRHHQHRRHRHYKDSDSSRSQADRERHRERERERSPSRSWTSRRSNRSRKGSNNTSRSDTPPPPPPPLVPAVRDHPFALWTLPPQPPQPRPSIVGEVVVDDDDDVFRPRTAPEARVRTEVGVEGRARSNTETRAVSAVSALVAPLAISAPILDADPRPVLLQPTVYDPSAATAAVMGPDTEPAGLGRTASDGLSPRQLHTEQDMAEAEAEAEAKGDATALQKAKATVLTKLSREFSRRMGREMAQAAAAAAAATAAEAAAAVSLSGLMRSGSHVGHHRYGHRYGYGNRSMDSGRSATSFLNNLRLRERLFGEPPMLLAGGGVGVGGSAFGGGGSDLFHPHGSMESNSAVVPLIFSHA